MEELYDRYRPTDNIASLHHCRRTIRKSLQSAHKGQGWFAHIGRLLLHAGEDSEAMIAFEQGILSHHGNPTVIHEAVCEMCGIAPIQDRRHVCRVCTDIDLCEACYESYVNGKCVRNCGEHDFLGVPSQTWKTLQSPHVNEAGETLEDWIERLKRKWTV
ncbi:hypothetical protein BDW02DRAFT_271599 [Decorospora gaudefroyi]|uniref:ZZ-type domain-containing protein n=1 Tax=Decorospora gaudefroyi TaxID=184978 RepID=A0A6A5JX30_9PLEO|nr:hypothetical protein BDW02DRAFT_271599 [Decorospora gaudefroyi]